MKKETFVDMTIKGFKTGQTAYIIGTGQRLSDDHVSEGKVVKVGRKYVTVQDEWRQETRFYEPVNSTSYLVEDKDYGARRLLFPTSKAADDYREREELKKWLTEATSWLKLDRYTLAQFREVKKILEGVEP